MPRITKRFVDSLGPGPKEFEHWDDQLPGFGIRIKPSGVKTYVIRYRTPSGQRRLKLGRHGKLTPEQARNLAKARFAEIEAGGDPSAVRQENRAAPTLREFSERYLKDYVEVHHKAGTAKETRRLIERNPLPRLGDRKVLDISYEEVARLHGAMRETPIEANRTLSAFRGMMNKAEKWGLRPRGTNPCRDVDRNPESLRDRHLSFEELARLGASLREAEADGSLPWQRSRQDQIAGRRGAGVLRGGRRPFALARSSSLSEVIPVETVCSNGRMRSKSAYAWGGSMHAAAPIEIVLEVGGEGLDAELTDRATRSLLAELRELPIDITLASTGPPPRGAKAAHAITTGQLAVTALPGVLGSVVAFLQSWLRRSNGKTITIKWIDGKKSVALELPAAAYTHEQLTELLGTLGVTGSTAGSPARATGGRKPAAAKPDARRT
jgi:hypothetical protein